MEKFFSFISSLLYAVAIFALFQISNGYLFTSLIDFLIIIVLAAIIFYVLYYDSSKNNNKEKEIEDNLKILQEKTENSFNNLQDRIDNLGNELSNNINSNTSKVIDEAATPLKNISALLSEAQLKNWELDSDYYNSDHEYYLLKEKYSKLEKQNNNLNTRIKKAAEQRKKFKDSRDKCADILYKLINSNEVLSVIDQKTYTKINKFLKNITDSQNNQKNADNKNKQ